MLGKVMKYELRATGRELLPFFGLALAVCGVLRFLLWLAPMMWEPAKELLGGFVVLGGMLVIVAAALAGLAIPIVRFYRGMVSDEGYLSHTLPVKTGTHITARTVVGSLYLILGLLVALGGLSILVPDFWRLVLHTPFVSAGAGGVAVEATLASLPAPFLWSMLGVLLVFLVVGAVSNLVQVYVSIAIGQKLTRNKVVGSIAGYLLVNTVQAIGMVVLMMIPAIAVFGTSINSMNLFIMSLGDPGDLGSMMGLLWGITGVTMGITLVFTAIEWWLTWFFLDKKLNLE